MKKVIFVHGWGGRPDEHWFSWAKSELEKEGYEVLAPEMPNTDAPDISEWVSHLEIIAKDYDEDSIFVGHSIGCQTIMRFLERQSKPAKGGIFIAGWFDLDNMETEEEKTIAKPWIETPIDLIKVRQNLPESVLIISDNDPYGAFEFNKNKFAELGSKIVVLHDAGHITADDGFETLPQLLTAVLAL